MAETSFYCACCGRRDTGYRIRCRDCEEHCLKSPFAHTLRVRELAGGTEAGRHLGAGRFSAPCEWTPA